MDSSNHTSRFRRCQGDGMLLKLNRSALNIPVGDDIKPLRFWLDQAKRALKTAEEAMNADASDLKTAYIQFTRAAVILEDTVPKSSDFSSYEAQYELLQDRIIPAIAVESDKLWELLVFREADDGPRKPSSDTETEELERDPYDSPPPPSFDNSSTPPYIKATLHLKDEFITFLLPADLTFATILEHTRFALNRRCYSAETISDQNAIQLSGPMGLKEIICSEDDMDRVLDKLQDAFDLQEENKIAGSPGILQQDELPPSYNVAGISAASNTSQGRARRRGSVDLLDDIELRDVDKEELFLEGGIITLDISLW